jgi:hypothetical protein
MSVQLGILPTEWITPVELGTLIAVALRYRLAFLTAYAFSGV